MGNAWGQPDVHDAVVRSSIQRLTNIADKRTGHNVWTGLRLWPAALAMASVGTIAVDARREELLGLVLSGVRLYRPDRTDSASVALASVTAIDPQAAQDWLGKRSYTPADDLVGEYLREWLAPDLIESETQLTAAYERYQFLIGLAHYGERTQAGGSGWAPVGSFGSPHGPSRNLQDIIASELEHHGDSWPLVAAGLFGFSAERAKAAFTGYQQLIGRAMNQRY